jgi:hypothetical protein
MLVSRGFYGIATPGMHTACRTTPHARVRDRNRRRFLFMVRGFQAIDRLLWIVGLAHALMVLALPYGRSAGFRDQAKGLLKGQTVLGRRLTVGKLAEAIALDFTRHHRAWAYAWLL